jgi:hypothetical protein
LDAGARRCAFDAEKRRDRTAARRRHGETARADHSHHPPDREGNRQRREASLRFRGRRIRDDQAANESTEPSSPTTSFTTSSRIRAIRTKNNALRTSAAALDTIQVPEEEETLVPQLTISQSVAAGGVSNIISGWQYEYLPWPARIKMLIRTTSPAVAGAVKLTVFSGSETIQEESPIQGGGTAGTTPSELNTAPIVWDAPSGDRLKFNVRNSDAGAQTVDAIVYAYPLR